MTIRHDRYGELVATEPDNDPPTDDHQCDNGWINYDDAVPCLRCRPNLAPRARTPRPDPEVARAGSAAVRAALARHTSNLPGPRPVLRRRT